MVTLPDRWYCDTVPTLKFPVWSRGNAGEVYPGPVTPLSGTGLFFTAGELGYRDSFEVATLDPDEWDPVSPNNLIGCFGGYLYLNMSLARLFGVRMPGMTPDMVDEQYYGDLGDIPRYADEARTGDESPEHSERITAWVATEVFGSATAPDVDEHRAEALAVVASRGDLATASSAALLARMDVGELYRRVFCRHILNSAAVGVGIGVVSGVCGAIGRPELTLRLIANAGEVDSAAPSYAMWELSRLDPHSEEFARGLEAFLEGFGSRGPNEWELAADTWGTRPAIALAAIDAMRAAADALAPARQAERLAGERDAALAEVRAALAGVDAETQAQFEAGLRAAQVFGAGRERSKTTCILLVHELRLVARELGRRLAAEGVLADAADVTMLTFPELADAVSGGGVDLAAVAAVAAARAEEYQALHELEPPFFVVGEPPRLATFARRADHVATAVVAGDVLTGIPGCAGTARGRVRVILDAADPAGLEPGDVLVAPVTDPAWTPLFVPAGAVVVDVGAQITHAVIVSRELGIPCVVSVTDATRRIPDGAIVEVDGAAGTVTVLSLPD